MSCSFNHIHLYTTDPMRAAEWLASMLGGRLIRSIQSDGRARVDVQFGEVFIYVSQPPTAVAHLRAGRGLGIDHLGFSVPDVDEAFARLKEKGAKVVSAPQTSRPGVRGAFLEGPEGIIVEIFSRDASDYNPYHEPA